MQILCGQLADSVRAISRFRVEFAEVVEVAVSTNAYVGNVSSQRSVPQGIRSVEDVTFSLSRTIHLN